MTPELCIGTAQFGLSYGITNADGQVQQEQVKSLLLLAHHQKLKFLDTAQAYGNSEQVVGHNVPLLNNFHFISKLKSQQEKNIFSRCDLEDWEISFRNTCKHLRVNKLGSFLLHSPYDLRKDGSHFLVDWLLGLKKRGLVNRLGVSIYDYKDLLDVDQRILDLVQLPLSLFDQRLILDGTISKLKASSVAIHARSIYLQGLLLTPAVDWPLWVPSDIIYHQKCLEELAIKKKCSLIDLAIGFARDQSELEAIVLGICNTEQFEQLIKTCSAASPWQKNEWQSWSINYQQLLDPRLWPKQA